MEVVLTLAALAISITVASLNLVTAIVNMRRLTKKDRRSAKRRPK